MTDMLDAHEATVRSSSYYVARTRALCERCGAVTTLFALALPPQHETRAPEGEEGADHPEAGVWECANAHAFLFFVSSLGGAVQRELAALSASFRLPYRDAALDSYWTNHCENCAACFEDNALHCEPGGPFAPMSDAEAARIELIQITAPFAASTAGYALEPEFFGSMPKV